LDHPQQILDRDTVGRIFAGDISTWDDQAIQDLNPLLVGKLPPLNITIGYSDNAGISVPEVFKRALVSFSPLFSDALDAAGGLFSAMPPALRGTGFSAGTSSTNRLTWLKVHTSQQQPAAAHIYVADTTRVTLSCWCRHARTRSRL
jgi:hypothetical protein